MLQIPKGHFCDERYAGDSEGPRQETERGAEEKMYSEGQVIQMIESMATVAYTQGFQYAMGLRLLKKDSTNPETEEEENSKLVSQMLGIGNFALEQVNKFVPPKIRKEISLPVGKIKP